MRSLAVLPLIVISVAISLAFYFDNVVLLTLAVPFIPLQYMLLRGPRITNQESLEDYVMKTYGISCKNVISYVENPNLYVYFSSKLKDNVAVTNGKICVLKINGVVKSTDFQEGIEEAIRKLCANKQNEMVANN